MCSVALSISYLISFLLVSIMVLVNIFISEVLIIGTHLQQILIGVDAATAFVAVAVLPLFAEILVPYLLSLLVVFVVCAA